MTGGNGDKDTFIDAISTSIAAETFVRVTLGKFRGSGDAQKVVATLVTLKGISNLRVVTSHARRDVTQNYAIEDGITHIAALAGDPFLSATLFTMEKDLTLLFNKKREGRLSSSKPSLPPPVSTEHNRAKQHAIDSAKPYLHGLGITLDDGRVKPSMYPKFKQISHFIEIVDDLLRETDVPIGNALSVVDIGSGKGYLTFALYDHLTSKIGKVANVNGVEVRADLVAFCNDLAKRAGFKKLAFEAASADQTKEAPVDILIALHACDTATDDAIYRGIAGNAALIITAPCCQHELAPQLLKPNAAIAGLMKFGLFKQRQADLVTDAARCLLLEASGYKVKVIEFVSTEHTAKNLLIAAIRSNTVNRDLARRQYTALKAFAGFETQKLELRLAGGRE